MVVPTFNEAGNVETLIVRLDAALRGVAWRLIVVDDDSPDGTAAIVKAIAARDPRVQCLRRVGRRSLAGAVIEGILASSSPFVAVIDGDLQHDETRLPAMLTALRAGEAEMAIGTRFGSPEGLEKGLSPIRRQGSRAANWAGRKVLRTEVSDLVSGFFMIRRELVERVVPRLSTHGFKIMFDIIASQPRPPRIREFPYAFGERLSGVSKLDSRVVIDYGALLVAKLLGDAVPARTIIVTLVALVAALVHVAILGVALRAGLSFLLAQTVAAVVVLIGTWAANALLSGTPRRVLAIAGENLPGLVANLAVADFALGHGTPWWLAGLAGAFIGGIWTHGGGTR